MDRSDPSQSSSSVTLTRKLAAIFSADVQGYSRLMGDNEVATITTLTAYRAVMTTLIQQHHGRVVDSPGDNLLAEFISAVEAVQAAVAIQHVLRTRNAALSEQRQMRYRIGLNVGDVMEDGQRLYGDGVNIAARIESLAEGGGISLSGMVYDQVKNKLALHYEDQGTHQVKNIAEPVRVYRLVMDEAAIALAEQASQQSPPTDAPPAERIPQKTERPPRKVRPVVFVLSGVLLAAGAGLAVRYFPSPELVPPPSSLVPEETQPPSLPLPDKPSIAVLPFTNMSGDPAQEYFSDGMTDDLITDLTKISGLFVIARNSTFVYKGQAVNVTEIGRELGVRHVLEGSVRKAGNRVRINVQLIDAPTGGHVWAERYDRELEDIFALQDEITRKIVFALKVTLTPQEQERLSRYPTKNLEAYDAFLHGLENWWKHTKEAYIQVRPLAEKAIELDSEYAAAYALLSLTYQVEWMYSLSENPQQSLARATELAQKAITLDGSLSVARWVLGWCYVYQRRYEEAIVEGEQAIVLGPNDADAYVGLAEILNWAGQPKEALRMTEKAMRLNPRSLLYLFELGHAYYLLGRNEEAIAAFEKLLPYCPDCLYTRSCLISLYVDLDREEEAQSQVAEILQRSPNFIPENLLGGLPYKDQAHAERLRNALRKAGLK